MSDETLMERVASGDMEALGALFERYKQPLFGFLARMLHDDTLAEDVVLDTFLRVHERRHTYRFGRKFTTWLYTIAHHLAADRLRRRARQETPAGDVLLTHPADPTAQPHALCERSELSAAVQQAISALPADQRAVIVLREYEGFSYQEIAAVTGASETAVRVRAHRARQALRAVLEPYLQDNSELPVTFAVAETYK